jgi:hypothetical protein
MRRTARGPSALGIDATKAGKPPTPGFPELMDGCEAAA